MVRRTLYLPVMIVAAEVVACLGALLAVSEKAEATFPGKNGRIAYASYDGGKDFEIYTINPNGSGKTKVTNNDTDDIEPAYSPDGEKIAYFYVPDGEIYTIKVGGGGQSRVTNNDAFPSGSLGVIVRSGSFPE
jgi:Tol biopolymer transport system component